MRNRKLQKRFWAILLTLSMVLSCMSGFVTVSAETATTKSAEEENVNLALNKKVTVSSQEVDWTFFDYWAVDGDNSTRWSPGYSDEEWLQVDLGEVKEVSEIILDLYAEGPEYKVMVSKDGVEYETVLYEANGTSSNQVVKAIRFDAKEVRYVKYLQMQKRVPDADGNRWPTSINELEVYKYAHDFDLPTTDSIRIASFNIAAGDQPDIDVMKALLEEYDIDFAGMQEIDIDTSRNPYDMLAAFKGIPYRYRHFNKSLDYAGGQYGIGTISKTGILSTDAGMLSVKADEEPRSWQKSVVTVGGKKIAIYNTHLAFESVETNETQMRELIAVVDADPTEYKVITGDFNVDKSLDQLAPFWMNYNLANGKDGVTYDTFNGEGSLVNRAIDNVITTRNIKVNEVAMVDTSDLSDHNMFYIDCELLEEEVISRDFMDYLIGYAEKLNAADYTKETFAVVEGALAAAKDCSEEASQEEIKEIAANLKAAIDALVIYERNPNLALNKPVTVSSQEVDWTFFDYWAVDGDVETRWSPGYADEEWLQVDLGEVKNISKIVLNLYAEGPEYKVLISEDGVNYTTIHYETNGTSTNHVYKEYVFETTPARYVKYLQMQKRVPDADGNRWPTSISELEVYEFVDEDTLETIVQKLGAMAPTLSEDKSKLVLPEITSSTYEAALYGTSNESVIALDGTVYQPLSDMEVTVMYKVFNKENPEEYAITEEEAAITVPGIYDAEAGDNEKPEIIPGIREWKGQTGSFVVNKDSRIVIAEESLLETAKMVAWYLEEMAGWNLEIVTGKAKAGDISLALTSNPELGDEGYMMEIGDVVAVSAYGTTGILYAGATMAQILYKAEDHASLPKGMMRDYPQYEVRSAMLDVARLYVPIDYLEEITKYMAYFKLNQIHVHINDDEGEPDYNGAEYNSAFRIESKKYPEINQGGEYYTQEEYRNYQKEAAKYGIKVVTEIDTPGHSGFVRFHNPDYMFDNYHLDVANEDAVEFIKSLYDELLDGDDPVIQSDIIHIGTDEYWGVNNPTGFSEYMNELIAHVNEKGYEARFWSNGEINTGMEILNENVSVNMWGENFANYDYWISEGFKMVNNDCYPLYIVPGSHAGFVDYYNLEHMYDTWEVQYMNPSKSIVVNLADPQLLGGESALWNDFKLGHSQFDDFARMKDQIMLMAEKNWYGVKAEGQTGADFVALVKEVADYAPGANPARFVPSESDVIVSYDFENVENGVVADASGNGYDGSISDVDIVSSEGDHFLKFTENGCLSLPFDSIGFPYTVEFQLYIGIGLDENTVLFDGKDGTMYLNYDGTGKIGYERKGYSYIIDAPYKTSQWIDFVITCDNNGVSLYMDGVYAGSAEYYQVEAADMDSSTFVFPVEEIGKGMYGCFDNFVIRKGVSDLEVDNLAYRKDVEASSLEVDYTFFADWAVDGDPETRWSPGFDDEEWIVVDLGSVQDINKIVVNFMQEAPAYEVLISEDGVSYDVVYEGTDGCCDEAIKEITFETTQARYVKYLQKEKCWIESDQAYYGSSIYELEVYNVDNNVVEKEDIDITELQTEIKNLAKDIHSLPPELLMLLMEVIQDSEEILIKKNLTQADVDGLTERVREIAKMKDITFEIVKQPESVAVHSGTDAVVTVEAVGKDLTYKWYYKNPGNKKFYDSGTQFVSEDGATYTIPMYAWRDGQEVYCVITDANGDTLQSNTVTLSMDNGSILIVKQPESVVVDTMGDEAVVTVDVTGEGLTYQWFYKNPGNVKFYTSGTDFVSEDGASYTISVAKWRDGQEVYCVITDANGVSVQTETVTLSVAK